MSKLYMNQILKAFSFTLVDGPTWERIHGEIGEKATLEDLNYVKAAKTIENALESGLVTMDECVERAIKQTVGSNYANLR